VEEEKERERGDKSLSTKAETGETRVKAGSRRSDEP